MAVGPKLVQSGEGRVFRVLGGDVITCKAVGEDTSGSFSLFETITPPQGGPPLHVHHREDESFYVLEGEFEFYLGEKTLRATPGMFLMAPRELRHTFRNAGEKPGKLLIIVEPSGLEHFFEEFSQIPLEGPPDFGEVTRIGAKYGIEFVPG